MQARRNTRISIGTAPTLKVRIRRSGGAAVPTFAADPATGPRRRRIMRTILVIGLLAVLLAPTAAAECRSPEQRQFDFRVGDWDADDFGDTAHGGARAHVA